MFDYVRLTAAAGLFVAILSAAARPEHAVAGQTTNAPAFDVVSIKLNKQDTRGFIGPVPGQGGYIGFAGASIRTKVLIMFGYGISDSQITGGPPWIDSEPYDIDARTERPVKLGQINFMIQTLLADRFHLKVRRENKEESVYELVADKESPNLLLHADDGTPPSLRPGGEQGELVFQNVPLARLVLLIEGETGRNVVDKTGLEGNYDFKLKYTSSRAKLGQEAPEASGPDIFGAVQRLGLKLRSGKGPVEYLFIEHIDPPTPN